MAPVRPFSFDCSTALAVGEDLLTTSSARTFVAVTLISATLFLALHAVRPTRIMPHLESRLREVEDLYYAPITAGPFSVDTTGSAAADLALELIALQDKARNLRIKTLRSTACPMAWWRELCATCTGQSLAIWRCNRDLTRLRNVLQLRIQEQIDIFHSEFAGGHSAAVRLESPNVNVSTLKLNIRWAWAEAWTEAWVCTVGYIQDCGSSLTSLSLIFIDCPRILAVEFADNFLRSNTQLRELTIQAHSAAASLLFMRIHLPPSLEITTLAIPAFIPLSEQASRDLDSVIASRVLSTLEPTGWKKWAIFIRISTRYRRVCFIACRCARLAA
ncbi:hypothetical protein DFH09DRAFT_1332956 [Mycena vulgaris]|nr:hypothetical protein DFH09DRAFT_1332956 [Mycena vulgaris]